MSEGLDYLHDLLNRIEKAAPSRSIRQNLRSKLARPDKSGSEKKRFRSTSPAASRNVSKGHKEEGSNERKHKREQKDRSLGGLQGATAPPPRSAGVY